MVLTLDEAKAHIQYYKVAHPNHFKDIGGENITDEKIEEALRITEVIAGGLPQSEDEIFINELKRICNDTQRS